MGKESQMTTPLCQQIEDWSQDHMGELYPEETRLVGYVVDPQRQRDFSSGALRMAKYLLRLWAAGKITQNNDGVYTTNLIARNKLDAYAKEILEMTSEVEK